MKLTIACFSLMVLATSAFAQTERQILVTPNAEHPQAAKDSGLGGRVTVYVTVDQAGNVVSVGNVSGPDSVCSSVTRADVVALRESARSAAANAKFAPATLETSATIPLNFDFPSGTSQQGHTISHFPPASYTGPVNVAPKAEVKRSAAGDIASVNGEVHAVKSESVFTTKNAPPPDNAGAVVSGGMASPKSTSKIPSQISGGVLNGKATNLPKPPFPPAARAVRAEGAVSIQVLVDEAGNVFSAAPVSGHPLLRAASREAACGASFAPTMLSGTPVKVSGVIVYNFVP